MEFQCKVNRTVKSNRGGLPAKWQSILYFALLVNERTKVNVFTERMGVVSTTYCWALLTETNSSASPWIWTLRLIVLLFALLINYENTTNQSFAMRLFRCNNIYSLATIKTRPHRWLTEFPSNTDLGSINLRLYLFVFFSLTTITVFTELSFSSSLARICSFPYSIYGKERNDF